MKASTKRLLVLLSSAVLIFVTFIIYVGLLKPEYDNIQELRGDVASRVDFHEEQFQAVDYVNNLYEKNKISIEQIQNDLSLALPDQEEVADVVYQIQRISSLNNIVIESINLNKLSIQQSVSKNPLIKRYGTLEVSLKLSGTYASFKELLRFLENNIRIMDVKNIRVYQINDLEKNIFNYELVVDTYYQIK
ncbi:type 4a pilus biogenesis protein PilO [Patescibacteria group bacterium]|nr:type 4a pilus biogenesis protein PilO [Patescibacteria group bacterium]